METRTDEIADGIYRLSTLVEGIGPDGLTFNQFLVDGDEPFLFHTGMRSLFPTVSEALSRILPLERLRWIGFSHVEADECGALDGLLAAAPDAVVAHGRLGCDLWLNDQLDRAPRALADGEVLDIGGRRLRWLDTPHVPHDLNAGLMLEEVTGTLFCSDLFAQAGDPPATTADDILEPTLATLQTFSFTPIGAVTGPTLRRLADLKPDTLAIMHGATYRGDGAGALAGLAAHYDALLRQPA